MWLGITDGPNKLPKQKKSKGPIVMQLAVNKQANILPTFYPT
jgi:hypothetical protein